MSKYTEFHGSNPFGSQAKMLFHYDRVRQYQNLDDCYPISMEINLTNKCNLKCKWCINENFRGTETLDKLKLFNFLRAYKSFGGKSITLSGGGEPTLHPDFMQIAEEAKRLELDIGLMTNGFYRKELYKTIKDFNWVRFSVDTLNSKKYKEWKGIDALETVIHNICMLDFEKVNVGVNCNVGLEHEIDDVYELIEMFKDKVDYIQFRPILPRWFKEEKTEINEKVWNFLLTKYQNCDIINLSNDKLGDLKNNNVFPFDKCDAHFFIPILNANGDICTCMYHPDDDRFVFGNINEQEFFDIWNGNKRKEVIKFVRNLDYCSICQVCCKGTEVNKFLDFINNPSKMKDVNFI